MAVKPSTPPTGRAVVRRNMIISVSGTHFYQKLSKLQDLVRPEGLGKLIKTVHLIGGLEPATFWLVAQCLNYYDAARPYEI
jgi:hypothetical protein